MTNTAAGIEKLKRELNTARFQQRELGEKLTRLIAHQAIGIETDEAIDAVKTSIRAAADVIEYHPAALELLEGIHAQERQAEYEEESKLQAEEQAAAYAARKDELISNPRALNNGEAAELIKLAPGVLKYEAQQLVAELETYCNAKMNRGTMPAFTFTPH
jgi:hypothetical protein